MAFISPNSVKVVDHIEMTRIGFGENPVEDALLLSLKDLNNAGTGAASYKFTPKDIARRVGSISHKTFAKRTIDMVVEDVKIKPIVFTTRTSDTVFNAASAGIAATLQPWQTITYSPTSGWGIPQSATVQSVSSATVTLVSPGITGYVSGDTFLPGSFAKATGANRSAGGFENELGEYTNFVQMDVRKVVFDMDELNLDDLYKPETMDMVLNKFDIVTRSAKFGALMSFYAGRKATFNDPDGRVNYTVGWYFGFVTWANTNFITSGTRESRKKQLHQVVSKVKRSGLQNMKMVYLCTNKFKDELLNLYAGDTGLVIQPSSTLQFKGIDANFETYRVNGFSMDLGASSIMDEMFPNDAVAIPVSLNHTSIFSLPYIRVDGNLNLDQKFNQGQIWEAPVNGAAIDQTELYFGYAWSWIFNQVGTDSMQYIYLTTS